MIVFSHLDPLLFSLKCIKLHFEGQKYLNSNNFIWFSLTHYIYFYWAPLSYVQGIVIRYLKHRKKKERWSHIFIDLSFLLGKTNNKQINRWKYNLSINEGHQEEKWSRIKRQNHLRAGVPFWKERNRVKFTYWTLEMSAIFSYFIPGFLAVTWLDIWKKINRSSFPEEYDYLKKKGLKIMMLSIH